MAIGNKKIKEHVACYSDLVLQHIVSNSQHSDATNAATRLHGRFFRFVSFSLTKSLSILNSDSIVIITVHISMFKVRLQAEAAHASQNWWAKDEDAHVK